MSELDKYLKLLDHQEGGERDEFAQLLDRYKDAKFPEGKGKQAIWDAIDEAVEAESPDAGPTPVIPLWRYVSIAASVLLLAVLGYLFFSPPTEPVAVATALAERTTHLLPDGSTVSLSASSSINYTSSWNRTLQLSGEAFFEVTEGSTFTVVTDYGTVQVLGTSFNVIAREEQFEVACKTGKVSVDIPTQQFQKEITPGEVVALVADTIRQVRRAPELLGKWQRGEFYFENQPIATVIKEVQRQFGVEVQFNGEQQLFSGYFTSSSLENALDMICLPSGLSYEQLDQDVYVISPLE